MNPIDSIGSKIELKGRGPQYKAKCPAHEDNRASLSVREIDDGSVALHCHAGCTPESVLGAIGMTFKDLYPERNRNTDNGDVHYVYTDRRGRPAFRKTRTPQKKFWIERMGDSEWVSGLNGQVPELYNCVQVLMQQKSEGEVWVVEGEKDCESLHRKGIVATTGIFGAGKWKEKYTAALQGCRVTIVRDKDEAGAKHAELVYKSLTGKARSLRIVEAKTGKDSADHFVAGFKVEDFVPVSEPQVGRKTRLASEITTSDVPWLWRPYLIRGEMTLLEGKDEMAKSYVSHAICAGLSVGVWVDGTSCEVGRSLICSVEDDAESVIVRRLEDLGADLSKIRIDDSLYQFNEVGLAELDATLGSWKPDIVVFDPVLDYMPDGYEINDFNGSRHPFNAVRQIYKKHRVSALHVRHWVKGDGLGISDRGIGSRGIRSIHRSQLVIQWHENITGLRIVTHEKCNYDKRGEALSFDFNLGVLRWMKKDNDENRRGSE